MIINLGKKYKEDGWDQNPIVVCEMAVQVNGKVMTLGDVLPGITDSEIENIVMIPNKLLNIVTKK